MRRFKIWLSALLITVSLAPCALSQDTPAMKDALKGKFLMGVATSENQVNGKDAQGQALVLKHFNSIVAENCMKQEIIQPKQGQFDFAAADAFVKFGEQHGMNMVGHTLVWHWQTAPWFFVDDKGTSVSREVLIDRMRTHIKTVMGRYKGRVHSWDVVNEAILDNGQLRETPYYKIIGKDYIKLAYQMAHEADPAAELNYNDYYLDKKPRREAVIKLVNELKQEGINIAAIGIQGHMTMNAPKWDELEQSIVAFSKLGVKVMITESDMTILPSPRVGWFGNAELAGVTLDYNKKYDPYKQGVPASVAKKWNDRYAEFFRLLLKHQDKISRVTFWGLNDTQSWRNDWPMRKRTDYPLLFDRNYHPKPIVNTIIEETGK